VRFPLSELERHRKQKRMGNSLESNSMEAYMTARFDNQQEVLSISHPPPSTNIIYSNEGDTRPKMASGLNCNLDIGPILIVEDDLECLKLVSKMAICLGHQPTMALNGKDALDHLYRANFGLVITDYSMPIVDGCQLAYQIKEQHFGTRIIMMTGGWAGDVDDLVGAGVVDGLLLKPFSLHALKEKIEMVCQANNH
jgi:two-component system response regulator (stage 0 sporulation protein F)